MTKTLNTNLVKIVNILNDGQYHDGTTIGDKLNMTRSAVWKAIKKLESYEIEISSIKGKGYALLEPLTLLDLNKIKKNLEVGKVELVLFETIGSTNEYLKTYQNKKSIVICLAEQQTQGKGRLSRNWYSPFGKNMYLSCLFPFQKDVSELAGLSLVTSLAITKTLQSFRIRDNLFVKWPNDIIYDNKKLSGCLIEIQAETHGISHAIIGCGINVNMLNDDHQITQAWTSMRRILGEYIDRNELCSRLINHLIDYLQQFASSGFSSFLDEWQAADGLVNQTITIKMLDDKIKGKAMGINSQGHLLLQLPNGSLQAFSSGEASIMKKP